MKLKHLKGIANNACAIVCGYRSMKIITDVSKGMFTIDLLNNKCIDKKGNEKKLHIAQELFTWFQKELTKSKIPIEFIKKAVVNIKWNFDSKIRRVNIFSNSIIKTNKKVYEGEDSSFWYF